MNLLKRLLFINNANQGLDFLKSCAVTLSLSKGVRWLAHILRFDSAQDRLAQYSADNINRLQKLITSRNLAFENRLRSFLKTNDQQVSIDLLDTLAIQSVHLVKDEATVPQPDPVMWYGYYDKKNKE